MSLPPSRDIHTSPILTSYRVRQGVLHSHRGQIGRGFTLSRVPPLPDAGQADNFVLRAVRKRFQDFTVGADGRRNGVAHTRNAYGLARSAQAPRDDGTVILERQTMQITGGDRYHIG